MNRSLSGVTAITEVKDYQAVNELLKEGWFLLDVYHSTDGFKYVLAQ